jgi:putative colanic acid biosynthesis acetyltransferase WcaF
VRPAAVPVPAAPPRLDVAANRRHRNYGRRERVGRVLWALARPFFRWSPRPCHGWRRGLLRLFGARVGREVHVHPDAEVTLPWNLEIGDHAAVGPRARIYDLGPVRIGRAATVSQDAYLCGGTHDVEDPEMRLLRLPVVVEDQAWVAAGAFVGPGVTVGEGSVVGARAVVTKDVSPWTIVAGNPARPIGARVLRRREDPAP